MKKINSTISPNDLLALGGYDEEIVEAVEKRYGRSVHYQIPIKQALNWLKRRPLREGWLQRILVLRLDLAKDFIKAGANINAKGIYTGDTALHWMAYFGKGRIVRLLLENGADPTILDKEGYSAADLARLGQRYHVVKMLEEAEKEWKKKHTYKR